MRGPSARGTAVLVLLGVCLTVAGCGGSSLKAGGGVSAGSQKYVDALKFSRCMRANGVSNFPDPQNPGGWPSDAIDSLNTAAPAFTTATNKCDKLLPNSGQPTSATFEQAVVSAVKVAKCFRAHGVFMPDPGVQGNHLTIDMTHVTVNKRWEQVGAICTKKVFGYVAASS